ncbi:TIR domain-containing protein [Chlorobaculum sp. 24CR]|uniref:toll/interleukin-1 receptor domain-containing protein n=1 Tax=Chlorobaculum sp. 24CR TaxID=2508878 RepID=UPI00100A86BB|nr:pentapeptide repeat-containing protein [Chlorobaculum sp. 24CR]RXK85172.1 TIR domain-containing protein [Chlorobaculum sp. 24CR]
MNKKEPNRDRQSGAANPEKKTARALELLLRSVSEWNCYRKEHPDEAVEFNKKDFSEIDLSGADLSGGSFKAANFSGANLSNAIFRDAKLNGANFVGADLRQTDFSNADICGANLIRSDLSGANLDGANLSMTDLNHANLKGALLTQSRLNGANLNECDMREAILSWADLSGVGLSMANAGESDFHDARLGDADLLGADLHDSDMHDSDMHESDLRDANLHHANLHHVNLHHADLSEADLGEADLSEADLGDARLRWTNLKGANLSGADFSMANLNGANLVGANLCGVEFTGANLCDANLGGANLGLANFRGAELSMANLAESETFHTSFVNLDLRQVKGLDTINHRGPSEVSISTLYRSQGQLSEAFMRGCGVPEGMIDHVRSLSGNTFDYLSCIISYSSRDKKFVARLYADLQKEGVRCWLCPDTLKSNRYLDQHIDRTSQCCEKMLLIVSDTSMKGEWLKNTIFNGVQRESREGQRLLFPVSLVRESKFEEWDLTDHESGRNFGRELKKHFIPSFYGWEHDNDLYLRELNQLVATLKSTDTGRSCQL